MREFIAKIIDPAAFTGTGDDQRRRDALAKADQILAIDLSFDDLPPELQTAVTTAEAGLTAASLLTIAAAATFPALAAEGDDRPVYTALVKPLEEGGFYLAVLLDEEEALSGKPGWVGGKMLGDEAQGLAAEIEVAAAGGGTA
jgi:hypothetical protein